MEAWACTICYTQVHETSISLIENRVGKAHVMRSDNTWAGVKSMVGRVKWIDDGKLHYGAFLVNTSYSQCSYLESVVRGPSPPVISNRWSSWLNGNDLRIFVAEQALLQGPAVCRASAFTCLHIHSE